MELSTQQRLSINAVTDQIKEIVKYASGRRITLVHNEGFSFYLSDHDHNLSFSVDLNYYEAVTELHAVQMHLLSTCHIKIEDVVQPNKSLSRSTAFRETNACNQIQG